MKKITYLVFMIFLFAQLGLADQLNQGRPELLRLDNNTPSDADGARATNIKAYGETAGNVKHTLIDMEISHYGSGSDQKGTIKIKANDGDDGESPSITALEINEDGITASDLAIQDSDNSNKVNIDWNENDSSDRTLNLKVNSGNREIDMSGDLFIEAASRVNQDLTDDASGVTFTGGLENTPIGGTTPAEGSFSQLNVTGSAPAIYFRDTDTIDNVKPSVSINSTDIGSGTEDIDIAFKTYTNGLERPFFEVNADSHITVGKFFSDTVYSEYANHNLNTYARYISFILSEHINSGNFVEIRGTNKQPTDTDGQQAILNIAMVIAQSGTAAYDGIYMDITEASIGDGSTGDGNNLVNLKVGGAQRFEVDRLGNAFLSGKLTINDSATDGRLNLTERSAEPSAPASGDIYLDDGSNTASSLPGWRRYTGSAWEDISAGAGLGATAFTGLSDVPGSYTTANALYATNATPDGIVETTILATEPAANQFQLAAGTTALLAQGDLTVEAGTSAINQDVTSDGSPTFALVNAGTFQNSGDLTLGFDSDTITLTSVDAFTDGFEFSKAGIRFKTTQDARTTVNIIGGSATQEARLNFTHGNGANTRWDQQSSNSAVTFSSVPNFIVNSGQADTNIILRSVGAANGLFVQGSNGDVGLGTDSPSSPFEIENTAPYQTLTNTTAEDTDGGRESRISFKGTQSGSEETTLSRIEASHQGSSDDEFGQLAWHINGNGDGDSPAEAMRLVNTLIGVGGVGTALCLNGTDADLTVNGASLGSSLKIVQGGNVVGSAMEKFDATDALGPKSSFLRSKGSSGSPAAVDDDAVLGELIFAGYDGTDYAQGAVIMAEVNGTPGPDDMPTDLVFKTSADASQIPTERMRIAADGSVQFAKLIANTPNTFNYATETDLNDPLLASLVLLSGDNDAESDTLDLQDGTYSGQSLILIASANVDADDTVTIAMTDTTCTNCPTITLDTIGENSTLIWTGSTWVVTALQDAL